MEVVYLIISLPPPGLFIRNLVFASISVISESGIPSTINYQGDKVVIEVPRGLEWELLNHIFIAAKNIAKIKREKGILSPRPNKNDANTFRRFSAETGVQVDDNDKFVDFAFKVLSWAEKECRDLPKKFLESYATLHAKPSKLLLGGDNYAAIQLFKVEKYEYGKDFLEAPSNVKMQIKHDKYWLALLMAGFALTYAGLAENEMVFTTLPEDVIPQVTSKYAHKDFELLYNRLCDIVYSGEKGIAGLVSRIGRLEPLVAFIQLLSYMFAREWSEQILLSELTRLPLNLYRVRIGNTFTLIERSMGDLAPFANFAYRLLSRGEGGSRLLQKLERLCRCALMTRAGLARGCEQSYSSYYTLTMKVYQAISGSYNPYNLTYELGRRLTPTQHGVGRIFSEDDLRVLLDVLTF